MPISRQAVRILSKRQREFLRLHIDNPAPVTISSHQTRTALVAKHLLRYDRPLRPRHTFLTTDGRFALAVILSDAAEALVAAGVLDAEIAALVSARLAARSAAPRPVDPSPPLEQISPAMPL